MTYNRPALCRSFLLIFAGALFLCGCRTPEPKKTEGTDATAPKSRHTVGAGDDEPIVVVGGSLHIGAGDAVFHPDGAHQLYVEPRDNHVVRVKVSYVNDADNSDQLEAKDYTTPQQVTIVIDYCKNFNCTAASPDEQVTFQTDAAGQNLKLLSNKTYMEDAPRLLPNLLSHPRRKWVVKRISVTGMHSGTPFPCGKVSGNKDGECSMTIHYCNAATPGACTFPDY